MPSDTDIGSSPRSGGGSTASTLSSSSGGTTSSGLKEDGRQMAAKAVGTVRAEADKRKDAVTTQVQAVSSAIGSAADQIERQDDLPSWLVGGVRKVATSVEQFAGRLEGKSSKDLFDDLKTFAGDRPAVFLAACAAAGFAASRVLGAESGQGNGQ